MRHAISERNRQTRRADWPSMAPAVCERLLGEPSGRSAHDLRWGPSRSFRLKLDTGTWSDFRTGEGGGLLSLVMREERLDKAGAVAWLESHGFLTRSPEPSGSRRYGPVSSEVVAEGAAHSRAIEGSAAMTNDRRGTDAVRWIMSQMQPIVDAPDHPIRRWMAKRNLWRPELPLPVSPRWIPADARVFRGSHSGIGAIVFPLAPISAWQAAYPETPSPSAVQLVCIDAQGEKADYENSQGTRVDKPKFGSARLAVWTVGDIRGCSASVCEGAADALAIAAREPDPVIATLSKPLPILQWNEAFSVFDFVTLWPDMDEEDKMGRRPGLDAAVALARARKLSGRSVAMMGVDVGKDAADAAREAPFGEIDDDELVAFAQQLQLEGMPSFEALRHASTLLK